MNSLRLILIALLFSATMFAAEVSIDFFSTKADGNNVSIEWRCSTEKSVQRYEIERSTDGQNFRSIKSIDAHGASLSYSFVDTDVLMKSGDNQRVSSSSYYYRLKIVGSDNSVSYSSISSVVHNLSSVRRTWGMIKEMFR